MAGPVKVDGKWRHRIMVKGVRTSGTFETKAAALAWEAEQRTVVTGKTIATTQTCQDAFDRYERDISSRKKGHRWEALRLAAAGRTALPAFGDATLGSIRVVDIDASHIAAYRDVRLKTVTGATVDRELTLLSHVFTIARKEWKWIKASPTTDVSRPKSAPPRFRRITQDEIDHITVALGWQNKPPVTKQQRVAAAFLFAIETGMRAGEIVKLTKSLVTPPVALVLDAKNGEDRRVPMSARAVEIWKMVPEGFGITAASIDALFRQARDERTLIKDLHFHDTRHEAITRLAKKLHVLDLARMTGHKDIRKLMIYYNESAEDIASRL
ncbi:tyrosine-type recombinase/integrase [Duganella sp. FT80W]|uniref:Tyrosine-type recombinase/integrase n=2 Tax=Duganella guangzhouensis TaxID=2666084 RepID=A0A6I2KT92_9BURK|nr:tyrosine-type recombinase/integrase [Duganella guangzhouensis]